jgi:hypothetical protein
MTRIGHFWTFFWIRRMTSPNPGSSMDQGFLPKSLRPIFACPISEVLMQIAVGIPITSVSCKFFQPGVTQMIQRDVVILFYQKLLPIRCSSLAFHRWALQYSWQRQLLTLKILWYLLYSLFFAVFLTLGVATHRKNLTF